MSNIKVAVRCRPLFEKERPATGLDFQGRRILLDSKTYDPDYIFPHTATQDDVFGVCQPILQSVRDGLHGTVMVYGQTGTGKTHTMLGGPNGSGGLAHRMIAAMLDHVQQKTLEGAQCALTLSMIEIYNEKLTDMLSESGAEEVTLIGGFPKSTTRLILSRLDDAVQAIQRGLDRRHTAVTLMNERSSRSHVVIIVDFEEQNAFTDGIDVAHLFLVDLAGSESLKKSQASGTAAGEAGKINKSLLALKSVFLALANSSESTRPAHVPYRDSKLTEILQDSIGGSARTLLIACISAVGRDIEETKSTLMYAVKARSIRNAANTEREKLMIRLRSFEVENQRLRNRLQERVVERGGYYITREEHDRMQQVEEEAVTLRQNVEDLLREHRQSDAREHITVSQTAIMQALLTEKEEELQRFKQSYQEALMRFDSQIAQLQRVVHGAVLAVRDSAQQCADDTLARLEHWHDETLREADNAEDADEEKNTAPGGDGGLLFTRDFESVLGRIVSRVNDTVASLLRELHGTTCQHVAAMQLLQEKRRRSRDAFGARLSDVVRDAIASFARDEDNMDRDVDDAHRALEGRTAAAVAMPPPANVLPLRHVAQDVCRAVVQSGRAAFPDPGIPDALGDALLAVDEAFRQRATAAAIGGLLVLGNAAPARQSNSSAATTVAAAVDGPLSGKDSNTNTSGCSNAAGGHTTDRRTKRVRSSGSIVDSRRASSNRMEKTDVREK